MEHELAHRSGSGVGHLRKVLHFTGLYNNSASFFAALVYTQRKLHGWTTIIVQLEQGAGHVDAGFQLHKHDFLCLIPGSQRMRGGIWW